MPTATWIPPGSPLGSNVNISLHTMRCTMSSASAANIGTAQAITPPTRAQVRILTQRPRSIDDEHEKRKSDLQGLDRNADDESERCLMWRMAGRDKCNETMQAMVRCLIERDQSFPPPGRYCGRRNENPSRISCCTDLHFSL